MKQSHAVLIATLWVAGSVILSRAEQFNLPIPAPSFGDSVTVLPNGNFVVTALAYASSGGLFTDAGAVYLYDGVTLALISTLTGSFTLDRVGNGGITVLSNGNYIVRSTQWHNSVGAVTWGSATNGVTGEVSSANSLVGSTANDLVGVDGITVLSNGNYVVRSQSWSSLRGAVTWGNGMTGVTGVVSAANSLVGSTPVDRVGSSLIILNNGNYVVTSQWNGSRGAATWSSATSGVTGVVSSANSLVGSTANDGIGNVVALNNGNYVVFSTVWDNGAVTNVGAVTWGNGTSGVTGVVSSANSLVGSTANDLVGFPGVTVLSNGNYVVRSGNWDNGAVTNVGAVTWGNGTSGVTGVVSSANSLVGSTANDQVGISGITVLNNGNYVVLSASWDNGAVTNVGAVTWGNGTSGVTGAISAANSLVGSTANDGIGNVVALNNGNYVVFSTSWDDGAVTNVGAVTWGNGTSGVVGVVSPTNSLVGSTAKDGIGNVVALNNGNYVVFSTVWDNGAVTNVGAVTWGNGTSGVTGVVSAANSLVGSTPDDQVGLGGVTALNNGNYVVRSLNWHNVSVPNAGAVTWGNGTSGVTGAVSAANSLVGSSDNDQVGISGVTALNNGNYVVNGRLWNLSRGAVTWGNGNSGVTGVVSSANSLVGSAANDLVGYSGVTALNNGNYVVSSPFWNLSRGAATWGNGTSGVAGVVSSANSLVGSANDQVGLNDITILSNGDYVVRSTNWDNGAVTNVGAVSLGDGTLGTTGTVSTANSVLGTVANGGASMVFAYDLLNTRLLVGYPAANRVSLFGHIPKILVQQALNVNLANGSTKDFGAPIGQQFSVTFTIRDIGLSNLTGLSITMDGPDASLFTITTYPAASLSFNNSTAFTVQFAPLSSGTKTAALHINSNDPQQNPFDINLTGLVLSFAQDSDGDGLSDAEEFNLAPLGFDWQVSQPALVSNLFANANTAGLFTTNQVQALNVGTPLLIRDSQSGQFTLTIGVEKSTNLLQFFPFPMTAPQTTINGQGNLEFQFTAPDNAAFFRLLSQ